MTEIEKLLIKNSVLAAAKRFTEVVKLGEMEFHFMVSGEKGDVFTLGFIDRRLLAETEVAHYYAEPRPWKEADSALDFKIIRTAFRNNPVTSDSFVIPLTYNYEKYRSETDFEKFKWGLWEILPDFIKNVQNTVTRNDIFINSKKSVY